MRQRCFEDPSKSGKLRGTGPAPLPCAGSSPPSVRSPGAGSARPVLLGVSRLRGQPVSVPGRRGAHGGPHGQRWVVAAAEERRARFRRLCNLTHWLRLHGSDEQSALLPKLISPAPPSPPPAASPAALHPPPGPRLRLFTYANSPGVRGVVCRAHCPARQLPEPLSALPVPFDVTRGYL